MTIQKRKSLVSVCALLILVSCLAGCQTATSGSTSQLAADINNPFANRSAAKTKPQSDAGRDANDKSRQLAEKNFKLGRSLEKRAEFERAMRAYREVLALDDGRADAYHRLAIIHHREGNFDESVRLFAKALDLQANNHELLCDLGFSFYLQDRLGDAEQSLRDALCHDPHLKRAHVNLGLVLAATNRLNEAYLESREGGCSEAEARTNLAFALTLQQRWSAAREQYELALAADPDSEYVRARLRDLESQIAETRLNRGPDLANHEVVEQASAVARRPLHVDETGKRFQTATTTMR